MGYSAEAPLQYASVATVTVLHPSNSGEGWFRAIMFTGHDLGPISRRGVNR